MQIELALPHQSSLETFERFQDWPWPILLHSADAVSPDNRWDIISAAPESVLVLDSQQQHAGNVLQYADGIALLADLRIKLATLANVTASSDAEPPFRWGALGYLGYESLHASHGVSASVGTAHPIGNVATTGAQDTPDVPVAAIGVYRWSLCIDRLQNRAWLSATDSNDPVIAAVLTCLESPLSPTPQPAEIGVRSADVPPEVDYLDGFARIHAYLLAGDCYQVNLARRFRVLGQMQAWTLFKQLLPVQPGAFSGFMQTPRGAVLCFSPERLLRTRGTKITSQPIKGTIRRGTNSTDDAQQAELLRASTKDRAENLMITDLTRNDLGRVCATGSVQVDQLFGLRCLPAVYHLESTVSGQLKAGLDTIDALTACFPAGSITGAPKRRAMQIIRELEPVSRSVYCGSLGYLDCNGNADFNVAIRTLVVDKSAVYCWGGGGIVADSNAQAELLEIDHKIGGLLLATRNAT